MTGKSQGDFGLRQQLSDDVADLVPPAQRYALLCLWTIMNSSLVQSLFFLSNGLELAEWLPMVDVLKSMSQTTQVLFDIAAGALPQSI